MTDEQKEYEKAICEVANVADIGDVSDGFHTFNQLYHQRAILFAALVNQNRDISWKTRKHEDGEPCFGGGWFLVTIDTPEGAYGYHYEDKYWDIFNCKELEKAKHWDGYTEEDAGRLMSLPAISSYSYYEIWNTISEWNRECTEKCVTFKIAKDHLSKSHCDWCRPVGTGIIYGVCLVPTENGTITEVRTEVYKNG